MKTRTMHNTITQLEAQKSFNKASEASRLEDADCNKNNDIAERSDSKSSENVSHSRTSSSTSTARRPPNFWLVTSALALAILNSTLTVQAFSSPSIFTAVEPGLRGQNLKRSHEVADGLLLNQEDSDFINSVVYYPINQIIQHQNDKAAKQQHQASEWRFPFDMTKTKRGGRVLLPKSFYRRYARDPEAAAEAGGPDNGGGNGAMSLSITNNMDLLRSKFLRELMLRRNNNLRNNWASHNQNLLKNVGK